MDISTQPAPARRNSRPERAGATDADAGRAARRQARARRRARTLRAMLPWLVTIALLGLWELGARLSGASYDALPAPSLVLDTLVGRWRTLAPALWTTARPTLLGLAAAVLAGVLLAPVLARSKWIESGLAPLALLLRATPIVAIAPLVLVYVDRVAPALALCAGIVAFHPVLAGTLAGLKGVDGHLRDLYALYGATRWQRWRYLLVPSALTRFLHGLRAGAGLALGAVVVGEFIAAAGGRDAGLAARILESMQRADMPMLFAALGLLALLGLGIFASLAAFTRLLFGPSHEKEGAWRGP